MKIKFKLHSKKKLAEFVYDLRNSFPQENLSERNNNPCIHINFSEKLVRKILDSEKLDNKLKREIEREINLNSEEVKRTKEFIKDFKKYWNNNINAIFFQEMGNTFGKKYIQKKYSCYPTDKVTGAYFGKEEITIAINPRLETKLNKFEYSAVVLAEEILHLIYWKLWQEIYNKKIDFIDKIFDIGGPRWSCWHIAEVLPDYLLVKNNAFEKFNWHKDNRAIGYTWIPKIRKELDSVWKNSKDMKEFIIKSHKKLGIKVK